MKFSFIQSSWRWATLLVFLSVMFLALSLSAQQSSAPGPSSGAKTDDSNISHDPPPIPVEQIIQKFGERELEFKHERDNYTYTQTFVVQVIDDDGRVAGEQRMTSDILFTPEGKRYEKVTYAPTPTLEQAG